MNILRKQNNKKKMTRRISPQQLRQIIRSQQIQREMVNRRIVARAATPQVQQSPQNNPQNTLKEFSILERTPFTPGIAYTREDDFTELDLMTGLPKNKLRGNLL